MSTFGLVIRDKIVTAIIISFIIVVCIIANIYFFSMCGLIVLVLQMTSIVKFEGVWGVGDETPHCYLLTVDDFTFLLDCGWDEKFDKSYIDRLAK